jgi:carboxypeptidase D
MRGYNFVSWLPLVTTSWALPESTAASIGRRQLPKDPTGIKTLTTANNVTIRYKEPGKEGVCETTPGVKSYSGYVDISPESHTFFWFFEARHNPETAPITLWLNGGPGSDSLIGLFEGLFCTLWTLPPNLESLIFCRLELGPCAVNSSFDDYINPHSWNEVSNLLFLSQPLGVGMHCIPCHVAIFSADHSACRLFLQ